MASPEDNFPTDYRGARKAFIAACEKAGADVIGRVHPARGPEGKPLFLDAAAFGPRDAERALLLVSGSAGSDAAAGSAFQTRLLRGGLAARLPKFLRLVLVHATDPAAFAWNDPGHSDPAWSLAMLRAVVREDLARAKRLAVLDLGGTDEDRTLADGLAGVRVTYAAFRTGDFGQAKAAVEAAIAAL